MEDYYDVPVSPKRNEENGRRIHGADFKYFYEMYSGNYRNVFSEFCSGKSRNFPGGRN